MLPIIALIISFTVSMFLMPVVIKVFRTIDLLDIPDRRKVHKSSAPSLGGLAFFSGFLLAIFTALDGSEFAELKYFVASIIMVFLLGVRDDISSLVARQKFSVQILAAVIVVFVSDIHFLGLYNVFGISSLPYNIDLFLSLLFIIGLTNAFNLIDGIDGLAGMLGVLASVSLGWCFLILGLNGYAIIAFALSGSLIAFLFFNWFPSKIFMGDTGSMLIGFICSIMAIAALNASSKSLELPINESLPIILASISVPLYDTIKVFTIRIMKGVSPFYPDRNHVHHSLLKIGLNHGKATLVLMSFTLLEIWFAYILGPSLGLNYVILILVSNILLFGFVIDRLVLRKKYLSKNRVINQASNFSSLKRNS